MLASFLLYVVHMRPAFHHFLLTLWVATAFFAPVAAGASLEAPEAAGMRSVAKQVYVDPEIPGDRADELQHLLEKAQKRVASFYGKLHARPKIVFCATADCYRDFGAKGLGFTDGTNLVISPQGQRIAIIAHELAHVEFGARIGGFAKVMERIPQWFDEGQAVMVSMAEEFSEEAWKNATDDGKHAPPLQALASMEDWIRLTGANGENMQLTYGTAKQEVNRWFNRSGHGGFQTLLQALQDNEPFAEAYSRIEAAHGHAIPKTSAGRQFSADSTTEAARPAPGNFARTAW